MTDIFTKDNLTASPTNVSWHADPAVRGTWDLIWTCLSMLLICAWNAVHTDISLRPRRWEFINKLPWLVVGLLAPDYLLYAACCQLHLSRQISVAEAEYLKSGKTHIGPWVRSRSFVHKFRACVFGRLGFDTSAEASPSALAEEARQERLATNNYSPVSLAELGLNLPEAPLEEAEEVFPMLSTGGPSVREREHEWTAVHSFYAAMGGFVLDVDPSLVSSVTPTPHSQSGRIRFVITAQGVCYLMEHAPGLIPDLSKASILNRCRSNAFAKALLVLKLFHFCVSCALRLLRSLPLSLFEVSTLAHAICAVTTYAIWWNKPFDIAEPTVIAGADADAIFEDLLRVSRGRTVRYAGLSQVTAFMRDAGTSPEATLLSQYGGLQESVFVTDGPPYWLAVTGFIAAVYGLIHLAAWNTTFPTPEEGYLWRIASAYALLLGIAPSSLLYILSPATSPIFNAARFIQTLQLPNAFWRLIRIAVCMQLLICIALYPVLTFYLLVESVRQVFYLPGDAFKLPSFSIHSSH
ncbi:uncharacterized protein PHACADRAFT_209689 [Phanerochaete carnosa HHB-10118-sp]|uniref:Transmembrane protein n=1 Tax=Phanerochaete carnosa (strain HHB-10118-sp) TaxID=650164 RepID=K5X0C2_PHACS|nr:uncharacterized protein PHACADRAFT_209689 [Phanerochaete carnosa HHB-10118-sp]EKM56212.1 hypothetical protein PHACADRAFT_209689 [Phanerochaete carnosa HHB-10118-sp]